MQRRAQQKLTHEKLSQKIERLKKNFIALHPISARREDAVILLDEIEGILESNIENEAIKEIEAIKSAIQNLKRDYKLEIEMNNTIDDYKGFEMGLERVKYAGLLASQETSVDLVQVKDAATIVDEENQINKPVTAQVEAVNKLVSNVSEANTPEITNNPVTSDKRRKNS
jgi:hypothetical protein